MRHILPILLMLLTAVVASGASPSVSRADVDDMLARLDRELAMRDIHIDRRQRQLDSISGNIEGGTMTAADYITIGKASTGFDNDLALQSFGRGLAYADSTGDRRAAAECRLRSVSILPLAGFASEAVKIFERIDTAGFDISMMRLYFNAGSKMYGYMATIYSGYPELSLNYDSLSIALMATEVALNDMEPLAPLAERLVNKGEYLYRTGAHKESRDILRHVIEVAAVDDNNYAIAAYILASIARDLGNENELAYYLALSALADTKAATREVTSLQDLGKFMLDRDDVDRSHRYLSTAMRNATEAHATTRMIQTASMLPLIEQVHNRELDRSRIRIYILIAGMAILILLLGVALIMVHRRSVYRRRLQRHLEASNQTKEIYISRFLDLCAIYMDKLNQFCKVASNKISTGQVDELYRLTRSGKFVENNTSDFYSIFDDAFLHMYPDFVENVNRLLRDDAQITLREGEKLNTDLRILAFMRLGIDDTAKVGRILNYSVNTIYAYRNKLRNRAKDRDTFEAAVTAL